jgi:hypothetical protein
MARTLPLAPEDVRKASIEHLDYGGVDEHESVAEAIPVNLAFAIQNRCRPIT